MLLVSHASDRFLLETAASFMLHLLSPLFPLFFCACNTTPSQKEKDNNELYMQSWVHISNIYTVYGFKINSACTEACHRREKGNELVTVHSSQSQYKYHVLSYISITSNKEESGK